jgi:hypothetical protein
MLLIFRVFSSQVPSNGETKCMSIARDASVYTYLVEMNDYLPIM